MTSRTRVVAATLALAASLGLSACGTKSPIQTDVAYDAADGVPVSLGTVQLRNLVLVGTQKDGPATITGQAINNSEQATEVSFGEANGGSAKVEIPAHSSVDLTADGKKITIKDVAGSPGDLVQLSVASPAGGTATVQVPLLDSQSYYRTLAPEGAPPPAPRETAHESEDSGH